MPETNPILQSLYARKSVRVFEEKAIPAGMKQAILEAAAQAPSAGCQQLYTILDITDPALKAALADSCDPISLSLPRPRWCWCSAPTAASGTTPTRKRAARPARRAWAT